MDIANFIEQYLRNRNVTGVTVKEKACLNRIARGLDIKSGAAEAGTTPEGERGMRKRVYERLGMEGATDIQRDLLATSLAMLYERFDAAPSCPHTSSA